MSNVRTYWDLTEAERAALTRDDVAKFVDYELMQQGVVKPKPLALVDVPSVSLETKTFYEIDTYTTGFSLVAFRTAEDARQFIALCPVAIEQDWQIGSDTKFATPLRENAKIASVELATRESVDAARAALKEAAAAKTENDRRRREHEEQTKKVEHALKGLWDDWHACVAKNGTMRRIVETFEEYKTITHGDLAIAARFLRKAFTIGLIREAEAWTQRKMTGLGEDTEIVEAPRVTSASAEEAVDF